MSVSVLDQFVNRSQRLFPLSEVARHVVELMRQPNLDAAALRDGIDSDPELTALLLRVVQSSLYGPSQPVADLGHAWAELGSEPMAWLALGMSLPPVTARRSDPPNEAWDRCWERTIIKAVAAREIAEKLWHIPGDEAFVAGLLQDWGQFVLIADFGASYTTFWERIQRGGGELLALEAATLGFDHVMVSSQLLESWGLPKTLMRAVSCGFEVANLLALDEGERTLPQVLHLADLVAELLTQQNPALLHDLLEVGRQYQGLEFSAIELVVRSLELQVPELADILSLQLPNGGGYATFLTQAYAQMSNDPESEMWDAVPGQLEWSEPMRGTALGLATSGSIGDFVETATLHHVSLAELPHVLDKSLRACRQARQALSLSILKIDHADSLVMRLGEDRAAQLVDRLRVMLEAIVDGAGWCLQVGEDRFAVILEGYERHSAVELARQLVRCVREWGAAQARSHGQTLSLSAGVATLAMPPKNFPCQALVDAAERCLQGVQLSGGDAVKSIDIY